MKKFEVEMVNGKGEIVKTIRVFAVNAEKAMESAENSLPWLASYRATPCLMTLGEIANLV